MNASARNIKPAKRGAAPVKPHGNQRISKKLREAIEILATDTKTQKAVAEQVGMGETSLCHALKRPHVAEALAQRKQAFALEVDKLKGMAKRKAILTGLELLDASQPASVRARMVEFFAGEPKNTPQIQVNVNQNAGSGYEFVRPGQMVEIIDAEIVPPDSISEAQSSQDTDE